MASDNSRYRLLERSLSPQSRDDLWQGKATTVGDLKAVWDACCERCGCTSCTCVVSERTLYRRKAQTRQAVA